MNALAPNHALQTSAPSSPPATRDHREVFADEDLHRHATENLDQADALLFGRVTYEMMEAAFRPPVRTEAGPDWMEPFVRTIDAAKKYVVSSTLNRVDWNAELRRGWSSARGRWRCGVSREGSYRTCPKLSYDFGQNCSKSSVRVTRAAGAGR